MAPWLDIDPHGRVVPAEDDTRRALADRAGRFALLPAVADLLVARRVPAIGGAAGRPRLLLAGDLAGFPIADFLAFVHQTRLGGLLTVATGEVERSVAFADGEVRAARSTAPGERLGAIAARLGFAGDAAIAAAAAGAPAIGRALVGDGALSENDLWKCLREQATAIFHAILLGSDGLFWMLDDDPAGHPAHPLAVSTQSLLMDGIRRIDELRLFRARIPGAGAFLRRREARRPVALRPDEQALLDLVDGHRTVGDLAAAAHLSEFDATKILYHLAEAGLVEAIAGPSAGPADPAARAEELARGFDDLLRLAAAAVPPAALPPLLEAVREHLADPAVPYAPLLRRLAPDAAGGIDVATLLGNAAALERAGPGSGAPHLVADALRELLFFYLFLAGERIDREADEALGTAIRRRLERLEALADP